MSEPKPDQREPDLYDQPDAAPQTPQPDIGLKGLEKEVIEYFGQEVTKTFLNLAKELGPNIEQHKYQLIIGDDPSGRMCSLVVGNFVARKYEADGFKAPMRVFIAGGFRRSSRDWPMYDKNKNFEPIEYSKEEVLRSFKVDKQTEKEFFINLAEYADELKKRFGQDEVSALFITEYIMGGERTKEIMEVFQKAGINCDLAAFEVHPHTDLSRLGKRGENLFIGDSGTGKYHKTTSGVEKDNSSPNVHGIVHRNIKGKPAVNTYARKRCKSLAELMVKKTFIKK